MLRKKDIAGLEKRYSAAKAEMAKHDHTHAVVKTEVLGLNISDEGKVLIPEAFGWDYKKFIALCDGMKNFTGFKKAEHLLNGDDETPIPTKVSVFADFLTSDAFKKLDVDISEPNDYLLLGFAWSSIISVDDNPISGLLQALMAAHGHAHAGDDDDKDDDADDDSEDVGDKDDSEDESSSDTEDVESMQ